MTLGIPGASMVVALLGASVGLAQPSSTVDVKVTQKYLVPVCLDGEPVKSGERRWPLAVGQHSMGFTMQSKGTPGVATVSFSAETNHRYEVEVRAPSLSFSSRVWERGEWKPVVRDRTVDRIVSSEPLWTASGGAGK